VFRIPLLSRTGSAAIISTQLSWPRNPISSLNIDLRSMRKLPLPKALK
jgi:hypothetical protein